MPQRLGELLLAEKMITAKQLEEAVEAQCLYGGRLGTSMIELGYLGEDEIAHTLSRKLHLPYIEPRMLMKIPAEVIALVPRKLACKHQVVPVRLEKKRLFLAMADPTNLTIIDALAFRLGFIIVPVVVPEIRLMLALQKYYQLELSPRFNSLSQNLASRKRATKVPATPPTPKGKVKTNPAPASATTEQVLELEEKDILVEDQEWPLLGEKESLDELSDAEYQDLINMPEHLRLNPTNENSKAGADRQVTGEVEKLNAEELTPFPLFCKALTTARNRDDIADAIINFIAPSCHGVGLLMVKGAEAMGWKGAANGAPVTDFDQLHIPLDQPSVVTTTAVSQSFYFGPLPKEINNVILASRFSPQMPETVLLLPLMLRQRLVTILYLQDSSDKIQALLPKCQLLISKTAMAFEMLILQNKIQMGVSADAGPKS